MSQLPKGLWSLKTIEKAAYLIGIPALLGYSGWILYNKAQAQEVERQDMLQKME